MIRRHEAAPYRQCCALALREAEDPAPHHKALHGPLLAQDTDVRYEAVLSLLSWTDGVGCLTLNGRR